jgi:hypothetical protein
MRLFGTGHHLFQFLQHEIVDPLAEKEIYDENEPEHNGEDAEEFEQLFRTDRIRLVKYDNKADRPYEEQVHENQGQKLFQEINAEPVPSGDKAVVAPTDLIEKEPYVEYQNDRCDDLPDKFNAGPEPEHGDADAPEHDE